MSGKKVKVSVSKERIEDRVGVTFRLQDSDDAIVIHGISPTSLFANTDLKVGMAVDSINDFDADYMSLQQAMKILREAEDVITIEATTTAAMEQSANNEQAVPDPPPSPEPQAIVTPEPSQDDREDAPVIVAASVEAAEDYPSGSFVEVDATPVTSTESFTQNNNELDMDRIVTVTATKPSPESLTGLGLRDHPEVGILIGSIYPSSIFFGSALKEGLKLLSINDTDCQFMRKEAAAAALRACEGRVTIRALEVDLVESMAVAEATVADGGVVTVRIIKLRQDSKVGLGISDQTQPNRKKIPVITNISSDGLCVNTRLAKGMRILSINGVSCRGRDDAVAMLRMAQHQLTIKAGGTGLVAATVTKGTKNSKVGLAMRFVRGAVIVSSIPKAGLFAKTDLRKGMEILQINLVQVRGLSSEEVLGIIARAVGTVTVLAKET